MMNTDAKDFLTFVQGYHNLFCGSADIIRHLSLRETIKDAGDLSRRPHTPPILTKPGNVDINKVRAKLYGSVNKLKLHVYY